MATAPRAGRKGGKVDSPAIAPESAPSRSPPSEIKLARADSEALPDKPQGSALLESALLLQFDPAAADVVGKGVVMGGSRNVRVEERPSTVAHSDAKPRLLAAMENQANAPRRAPSSTLALPLNVTDPCLKALEENDVVFAPDAYDLRIAVNIIKKDPRAMVMLIVPRHFEVSDTLEAAECLVEANDLPRTIVGEWVGNRAVGSNDTRLWLTFENTAFLFLADSLDVVAPFTHIVLTKTHVESPLQQCLFFRIRTTLAAASASPSAQRPKAVLTGFAQDTAALSTYFTPLQCWEAPTLEVPHPVVSFTEEEACAIAQSSVMSVTVDKSGKFPGLHSKIVEHHITVAVKLLSFLFEHAKSPLNVVVFTGDVGEMQNKLAHIKIPGAVVVSRLENNMDYRTGMHVIVVLPHGINENDSTAFDVSVAIDLGSVKAICQPNRSEGNFPLRRTDWQSQLERESRIRSVGWSGPGIYVALYPESASTAFAKRKLHNVETAFLDEALLQVARFPRSVRLDAMPAKMPPEAIEAAMSLLAEKCAIVDPTNLGITFLGELLSRLPLSVELSNVVASGLAMGVGEAAIVIAAVAALPIRSLCAGMTKEFFFETASSSRAKFGVDRSNSDVIVDAVIALKWKASPSAELARQFASESGLNEKRLRQVFQLVDEVVIQLADYAILENLSSGRDVVGRVLETVQKHSIIFAYIISAALASRAVIVRSEGQLGQHGCSGGMMFVRSQKNGVPNAHIPSSVRWSLNTVVVPALVFNSMTQFYVCDCTALKASYFFAALLLLSPAVEHSSPVIVDKGKYIIFGVTCNRQMKRFRVEIEDAAKIMDFREKWDQSIGCLRVLRSLPREATLTEFTLHLQSATPRIDLKALHQHLLEALGALASEMNIVEHQASFTQYGGHRAAPADIGKPILQVADPSDIILARRIRTKELPSAPPAGISRESSSTANPVASPLVSIPTRAQDADVERAEGSYFLRHGPIVEDDDDE